MRVFAKKALRLFWETPGQEDAEGPLEWWFKNVSKWNVSWKKFAEVKAMFGSASIFKDCVIFNIGGNKYRLIVTIAYPHSVFVVQVLTHHEYDKGLWKDACDCADQFHRQPRDGRKTKKD